MQKFDIIYADPSWSFNNKNTGGSMKSGADAHYKTMSVEEMCKLPVKKIANDNCILFMWWVASQPKEAIQLAESWGFKIKTMTGFNWVKTTKNGKLGFGMGFWTRQLSENCLIATKGKPKRANAGVRSVILAQNIKHSKKPDIFRKEIVKLMGDVPRIELFACETSDGWTSVGYDVDGIDIKTKLESF